MVALSQGHSHDLVGGDAQQLVLLLTMESDNEEGDAVIQQRLPRLDKVHLGLDQVQVLDVGVRLEDSLPQLNIKNHY